MKGRTAFIETRSLNEKQKREVTSLWNQEYPEIFSFSNISEFEQYLQDLADKYHILFLDKNGIVKGWLVCFIRDQERWFAMILAQEVQGKGLGSEFLTRAKKNNSVLNGWVINHDNELKQNGEYYRPPLGFYLKNGFEIVSDYHYEAKNVSGLKIRWQK